MDMSEVKAFNAELSGLYENKPPISKAKMSAITRGAIKAIKFYKHVVHSVEKFIQKCKPEYKVPGLYVIDSIVRQSRHQFGQDKDVFAPRFAKNMQQTFANLFRCPPEDKRNIIRVLNLWQKNHVFTADVIQPLMDMADPNHPVHSEIQQYNTSNGSILNTSNTGLEQKTSPVPAPQHTPHNSTPGVTDQDQSSNMQTGVKFNRKLLNDFEYDSEDDTPSEPPPQPHVQSHAVTHTNPADAIGSILTNPELMRQLQNLQAHMQMMGGVQIPNLMPMVDMQMQQTQNQNLPFLNSQPEPPPPPEIKDDVANESDIEFVETGPQVIEIPDANDSRSPTPSKSRRHRSSRSKSPRSRMRRRSRSRSPSNSRKERRRDRDRNSDRDREKDREREKEREREEEVKKKDREKTQKEREAEKEKQRERERKGLPPIKRDNLSVCSTTLWVGHLSKLATPEDLSDLFGEIGGVVSIDVVAPRGCAFVVMERRRDASKALNKLNKYKLHSKEITVAWAPGKGVKGREWKDYWEADYGVSYLPWERLEQQWHMGMLSMDALEEGGMVDEDTLPPWLPPRMMPKAMLDGGMGMLGPPPGMPPGPMGPMPPGMGLPGPMPGPGGPPGGMPMGVPGMPPPGMGPGMPPGMAPGMPPGIRPPSIPASVSGLQTDAGLPPAGALLGFPPGMPQSLPQRGMVGGFLGGLMSLGGLLPGMPPLHMAAHHQHLTPPPQARPGPQQPEPVTHTDDAMDLDTEENQTEDPTSSDTKLDNIIPPPLTLPDKLQELLLKPPPIFNSLEPPPNFNMKDELPQFNSSQPPPSEEAKDSAQPSDEKKGDRERDRRSRDRGDRDRRDRGDRGDRDRRERDRDRDRRERGGDRGRDRDRDSKDRKDRGDRGDRDRDRGRDRRDRDRDTRDTRDRDRNNRDNSSANDRNRDRSPRNNVPNTGQNSEKTLQERLWEMANGKHSRLDDNRPRQENNYNNDRMDDMTPRMGDMPPRMGDMPPRMGDMPPRMSDMPPRMGDMPPRMGDMPPRMDEMQPERDEMPPRKDDAPPRMDEMPSRMNDMPPRMGDMPPRMGDMPPRMGDMPPRMGDMPPRMGDMPPRHDRMPSLMETPDMEKSGDDGGWKQLPPPRHPPPHMAPTFRAELRMRGAPRPPLRGPWMEGPFGARFNGMPPFNRPPFERPPFDGGPPMFDGPPRFERPPFNRMPFDGNRPNFDGPNRPPFEPPMPFDGPRPPFDGPRAPFDGPMPPFEGPPPFDDPDLPFDGPPRFDGPPEFFDRNNRRFDDRDSFNERGGWNGDRDNRDRDWDRRQGGDWDERRRDRRPRDHEDNRYGRDRSERRRNYDDRPRTNSRDDRNSRRERDRKSRWGAADEASEQQDDYAETKVQEQEQNPTDESVKDNAQAATVESSDNTQTHSSSHIEQEQNHNKPQINTNDEKSADVDTNATSTKEDLYDVADKPDVGIVDRIETEIQPKQVSESMPEIESYEPTFPVMPTREEDVNPDPTFAYVDQEPRTEDVFKINDLEFNISDIDAPKECDNQEVRNYDYQEQESKIEDAFVHHDTEPVKIEETNANTKEDICREPQESHDSHESHEVHERNDERSNDDVIAEVTADVDGA